MTLQNIKLVLFVDLIYLPYDFSEKFHSLKSIKRT